MALDIGIPGNKPRHHRRLCNIWNPRILTTDTKVRILTLPRRPHIIARALGELTHQPPCKRCPRDIPIPSRVHQRRRLPRIVIIRPDTIPPNANDAYIARVLMTLLPLGYNHLASRCQLRTHLRCTLARPPTPGGRQTRFIITSGWGPPQTSAIMGPPTVSTTESCATESASKTGSGSAKEDRDHEIGNANARETKSRSAVALLLTPALARVTPSTIATATCLMLASTEGTTTTTSHTRPCRVRCRHDHGLPPRHVAVLVMRITNEKFRT